MKIVYKIFSTEEKLAEQFNQWVANGHNINNKFIRVVHTGDYYTVFYPERLDIKDSGLL